MKETGNRNCLHLKLRTFSLVNSIEPESILLNSNSLSSNEHMRKAWVSRLCSLNNMKRCARTPENCKKESYTFSESIIKVCLHISILLKYINTLFFSTVYLLSGKLTQTSPIIPSKNILSARGKAKNIANVDHVDTHHSRHDLHFLPSFLSASLFLFKKMCNFLLLLMNYSTACPWKTCTK